MIKKNEIRHRHAFTAVIWKERIIKVLCVLNVDKKNLI